MKTTYNTSRIQLGVSFPTPSPQDRPPGKIRATRWVKKSATIAPFVYPAVLPYDSAYDIAL